MELKNIIDKIKISITKDENIELTPQESEKIVSFIENILDLMMSI